MTEEKVDNRKNILDCAQELFYKKGYEGVGVQEIAVTAGVTKPTLYYYFKSKYGLLENLLETKMPECISLLNKVVDESDGLEDGLKKVAREYINFVINDIKFFSMFISMEYSPRESDVHKAVSGYNTELFAIFSKIFTKNRQFLGNMNGRQEQFAMGFMGVLHYYIVVHLERKSHGENMTISDNDIYMLVHQFMHGIFS